jgi:uncharacterized RDD family membrane protein YckC
MGLIIRENAAPAAAKARIIKSGEIEFIDPQYWRRPMNLDLPESLASSAAAGQMPVVGFPRRLAAYAIDALILGFSVGCLSLGGSGLLFRRDDPEAVYTLIGGIQCLGGLFGAAYFIGLWALRGQTLGNKLLGIRVIRRDGRPLGLGGALARYLGYMVSALLLGLGFVWIAFDAQRQGLHDKLAASVVVPENFAAASPPLTVVPLDGDGRAGKILALSFVSAAVLLPLCLVVAATLTDGFR